MVDDVGVHLVVGSGVPPVDVCGHGGAALLQDGRAKQVAVRVDIGRLEARFHPEGAQVRRGSDVDGRSRDGLRGWRVDAGPVERRLRRERAVGGVDDRCAGRGARYIDRERGVVESAVH